MEVVLRITIIYLLVLIGMRIMGKREFGQLSPVELVTLMLIPEIVSQSLVGEDFSLTGAAIGVTTLLILVFVTGLMVQRFPRFEEVVSGSPVVLAFDDNAVPEALNKERVSIDELYAEMRLAGIERLADVKWAILEADGKISIIGNHAESHPTTKKSEVGVG